MTRTMRVVEIAAFGPPEGLRLAERPCSVPGPGEVLLRVSASGVNRPDVLQRKGHYPPPPGVSDIPGLEVSGVIEQGDAAALAEAGLHLGDRVCALVSGGGYAEYCLAPVGQCLPVPPGWSELHAAGLPETLFTVWSNVFERACLQPGETLLVQGGASGIGVAAIQLAKALGSRVIVTVGSEEKAQACLALGADHAILYRTQDFVQEVALLTAGRGVDVILDMVAGPYVAREIDCLADDGRLVIIAVQGGVRAEFDAAKVLQRRLTVTGSTLRPRPLAFKTALARQLRERVWPLLASGAVRPVVAQVFAPGQAAEAHALMESSRHIGKILIDWRPTAPAAMEATP